MGASYLVQILFNKSSPCLKESRFFLVERYLEIKHSIKRDSEMYSG
jgi:hypothetical protein